MPKTEQAALVLIVLATALTVVTWATPAEAQQKHDCSYCHDLHGGGGSIPLTIYNLDADLCLSCHDDAAPATFDGKLVPKGVAVHGGTKHGADVTSCTDCHDHEGEAAGIAGDPVAIPNLKLIPRSRVSKYPLPTGETKRIVFTALSGVNSFADGDATIDGVCEVCHTATLYQLADGSNNAHNAQADCTACHTHSTGHQPSGCTGCHNQPQPTAAPTRRATVPEFDLTSHHINLEAAGYADSSKIDGADCQVCHYQGGGTTPNHKDGTVWLNDVDVPANGPYNSSIASELATFCIRCHDAGGAEAAGFAGGIPFSDGIKPPVIDGASWMITQHGLGGSISTLANTGQITGARQVGCLTCHDSGHGVNATPQLYLPSPDAACRAGEQCRTACDQCHGADDTAADKYANRHFDPHNAAGTPDTYYWNCLLCHTPHTNLPNRFYTDGIQQHLHYNGGGTLETDPNPLPLIVREGVNIKLFGRDEDGSGVARLRTPLKILSAATSGSCTLGNTQLEILLSPYLPDGEGLIHSILVGDVIQVTNVNTAFDGYFRVLETNLDFIAGNPAYPFSASIDFPTGWVCYDNPTAAPFPVTTPATVGWVMSAGWRQKPTISTASWASPSATLSFSAPYSIRYGLHSMVAGDQINVIGVSDTGYNGLGTVTAVTSNTVTYTPVGTPAGPGSGGTVEYVGSVKAILGIAVAGPPPTPPFNVIGGSWSKSNATLTLDRAHPFGRNSVITVSGVVPSGYNGTFTLGNSSSPNVVYPLATNPGAWSSGGTIPDPSPVVGSYTLTLTLNSGTNVAGIMDLVPATAGLKDGDIVRIYGANEAVYNGRWEVDESSTPTTVVLRCPPLIRVALGLPSCDMSTAPAYTGGGILQSTGTMRPVVFESRGTDNLDTRFLSHYAHSFTNTDLPVTDLETALGGDGWMDGPCETCHTATSNHKNFDFGNTHNNGKTCSNSCHPHSQGFDKAGGICPRPTTGCPDPAAAYP